MVEERFVIGTKKHRKHEVIERVHWSTLGMASVYKMQGTSGSLFLFLKLTPTIALLDVSLEDHVVNNDQCVLTSSRAR